MGRLGERAECVKLKLLNYCIASIGRCETQCISAGGSRVYDYRWITVYRHISDDKRNFFRIWSKSLPCSFWIHIEEVCQCNLPPRRNTNSKLSFSTSCFL